MNSDVLRNVPPLTVCSADGECLGSVLIELDTGISRLSAIKKAAYRFADRMFITIDSIDDRRVSLVLTPKSAEFMVTDRDRLVQDFRNELLDQDLREIVAEETEGIRRLLLAQAFSAISLTDRDGESADYTNDPLSVKRDDR